MYYSEKRCEQLSVVRLVSGTNKNPVKTLSRVITLQLHHSSAFSGMSVLLYSFHIEIIVPNFK